jgi:hypothetical protein
MIPFEYECEDYRIETGIDYISDDCDTITNVCWGRDHQDVKDRIDRNPVVQRLLEQYSIEIKEIAPVHDPAYEIISTLPQPQTIEQSTRLSLDCRRNTIAERIFGMMQLIGYLYEEYS